MLFYLSSQSGWQLDFFRVSFNGPIFFIIIFNDRAGISTQGLLFLRLPTEKVTINYLLVYMVQGPLTHLILLLLISLIFYHKGSGRARVFSHGCFETSNLLGRQIFT